MKSRSAAEVHHQSSLGQHCHISGRAAAIGSHSNCFDFRRLPCKNKSGAAQSPLPAGPDITYTRAEAIKNLWRKCLVSGKPNCTRGIHSLLCSFGSLFLSDERLKLLIHNRNARFLWRHIRTPTGQSMAMTTLCSCLQSTNLQIVLSMTLIRNSIRSLWLVPYSIDVQRLALGTVPTCCADIFADVGR